MPTTKPIRRRPLNSHQITLLQLLYKFRYATSKLIAEQQNANHIQVILSRLKILEDQGYVGRRYESSYKLKGKPASYYLLLGGIRYLRKQPYTSSKVLTNAYYDKNRDDHVIEHYLHVFKVHNELNKHYRGIFHFFSQSELREKTHFPKPRPDAYVKHINSSTKIANDYFLLCFEEGGYWTHRRRIRTIIEYAEHETWEKATGKPFPTVLVICENSGLQKGMQNLIAKELDMTFVDLKFIATTSDTLDFLNG